MKWIQLIDSGGQPQFHHLLPLFVRNLSVVIFVLKLSEGLDYRPDIAYFGGDGRIVGNTSKSLYSHKQVLERCLKAVHSCKTVHSCPTSPQVMVVGTHKDLVHQCCESTEDKNKTIIECLKGEVLYKGQNMKEVIFEVNSQSPQEEDKDVAKVLRGAISELTPIPDKVPMAWFGLEVMLHDLAQKRKREVLSLEECRETAKHLKLTDEAFNAALIYFVGCNIFLHYPDDLPDVVFCNPQVLLSIITDLVQYRYKLLEQPDQTKPTSSEWKRFTDYAFLTKKFLDSIPGHYHKDIFTSADLLKLFVSRSIVAPVGNEEYLMPALLPELDNGGISPDLKSRDPLLIRFRRGCFPSGVFCSLVAYLLNDAKWSVCIAHGKPKCLYSNSVTFTIRNTPATVTVSDDYSHIAVHIIVHFDCIAPHFTVRSWLHRGIIAACTHLDYLGTDNEIIDAMYCMCGHGDRHYADIGVAENDSWVICCHDETKKIQLSKTQKHWFSTIPSLCQKDGKSREGWRRFGVTYKFNYKWLAGEKFCFLIIHHSIFSSTHQPTSYEVTNLR